VIFLATGGAESGWNGVRSPQTTENLNQFLEAWQAPSMLRLGLIATIIKRRARKWQPEITPGFFQALEDQQESFTAARRR